MGPKSLCYEDKYVIETRERWQNFLCQNFEHFIFVLFIFCLLIQLPIFKKICDVPNSLYCNGLFGLSVMFRVIFFWGFDEYEYH